jgi:HPt (histidine-containing phosphotransfer) domain-containing protein
MTPLPDALSAKDFDRHAALDRLGGDGRVLASLISHLLTSHASVRLHLEKAQAAGQPEEILAQAHTLAGAAGNLGLVSLHQTARAVVTAIRQGVSPQPAIIALGDTMEHLLTHWQALLDSVQPAPSGQEPAASPAPSPPPRALEALCRALTDRDYCSVELYATVRPWIYERQPGIVELLDHHMDLLNFKDAQALLASALEQRDGIEE